MVWSPIVERSSATSGRRPFLYACALRGIRSVFVCQKPNRLRSMAPPDKMGPWTSGNRGKRLFLPVWKGEEEAGCHPGFCGELFSAGEEFFFVVARGRKAVGLL